MGIVTAISLALKAISGLVDYLGRKQIIDLGEAKAIKDNLLEQNERLARAVRIKKSVNHDNVDDEL